MKKAIGTHGGRRPGAGRSRVIIGETVHTSMTISKAHREFLLEHGAYTGRDGKERRTIALGVRKMIEFYQAANKEAQAEEK